MVQLTVERVRNQKRYKLEELLELQNKLMLMSTKGERSVEQVRRFTEVSGSYGRQTEKLWKGRKRLLKGILRCTTMSSYTLGV